MPAGVLLLSLLAACGANGDGTDRGGAGGGGGGGAGGGGGGGGSGGGSEGSEDGGSASDVPDGAIAAELEVTLPNNEAFTLSGTFPVPKGVVPNRSGKHPYKVADYDGTLVDTQVEIVTRYPDPADGADVVEVIARVRRDPSLTPGQRATYQVVRADQAYRPDPGTPDVEDLRSGPVGVPSSVRNLLSDPKAIRISARDCFGNEYTVYPLDGSGKSTELTRYGHTRAQLRTYQTMMPEPVVGGSQGTLPHFLGVHSYLSTWTDEELIGLDVRFNNASSNLNPTSSVDDALDAVYFDAIEVTVPSGWVVQQDFPDPYFGDSYVDSNGDRVYPVVEPLGDGTFHVLRWQGQFHRRLMIRPSDNGQTAYAYLQFAGQAFCKDGTDPTYGHELYSWWNQGTARYFPQSFQLPSLAHITNLGGRIQAAYDDLRSHLENGTNMGDYPVSASVMGWGHPYGVAYGGMTSGNEIYIYEGVDVAYSRNKSGLMALVATHRMHTDRMPLALYDEDGTPSTVEDWVVRVGGDLDYVPFEHFITPFLNKDNPFGLENAPRFQIDHVRGTGKQPYYEYDHFSYEPHDYQHYIRYTRAPKTLLWLANDALSRDDLELCTEMFRLSYHRYRNSSYGNYIGSGLKAHTELIRTLPESGSPFGRGEAWGIDCALAAYASGSDELRARLRPWLDQIVTNLSDSQMCSGFLQSQVNNKFLDGQYRGRQAIEQAITENALRGTLMTVYKDYEPALEAVVEDVLERSLYAFISPMAWEPGTIAPATYTAIGPLDTSRPVYCNAGQMPNDGYEDGFEKYQNWSSFAYAYERTGGDPIFLDQASIQLGGMDLLFGLEQAAYSNVWNQSALLALAQRLNGDL